MSGIRKMKRQTMARIGGTTRVEFRLGAPPEVLAWLSGPRGNAFVLQALRTHLKRRA